MISLSDSEMSAVIDAARSLDPLERSTFLNDVVSELQKYPELGSGIIGRVTARLQRQYLNTPRKGNHVGSKWG